MSQPLEVKARFVIDPQGAKDMARLAAETVAATKAEKEYQAALKQRAAAAGRVPGGEQAQVLFQEVREREAAKASANIALRSSAQDHMQAERDARVSRAARAAASRQTAAAAATKAAVDRQGVVQSVAGQLGPVAGSLAQSGFGIAGSLGAGGLMGAAAGGVAVAGLVAREAAKSYIGVKEANRQVNAPGYSRVAEQRNSLGFGIGSAHEFALDFARARADRPEKEGRAAAAIARGGVYSRAEGDAAHVENTLGREVREAERRSAIVSKTQLEVAKTIDRSKAFGDRLYAEEQGLLPLRHAMKIAAADRLHAERESTNATNTAMQAEDDFHAANKGYQTAMERTRSQEIIGGQKNLTGGKIIDRVTEEQLARMRTDPKYQDWKDKSAIALQKKRELTDAQQREGETKGDFERRKFGDLQAREQAARGDAMSLGGLSTADFGAAKIAAAITRRQGFENTPADIQALALRADPEGFGKEQEALGNRRAKELGNRRDDLDDIRGRADAQGNLVTATENQNRNDQAERAGTNIGKAVAEAIKVIEAGIRVELDKIKSDASLKASRIQQ